MGAYLSMRFLLFRMKIFWIFNQKGEFMTQREFMDKMIEHKHALLFVGGMAAAVVGKKVLESQATKDYAAKGMAKVLTCKSELEESIQDIKDNAEDIHTDAKAAKKEAVCVDVTSEDE